MTTLILAGSILAVVTAGIVWLNVDHHRHVKRCRALHICTGCGCPLPDEMKAAGYDNCRDCEVDWAW